MKIANITDAKNGLSTLIDGLKVGSPVLIVDRGRPVAWLEAVAGSAQEEPDSRLLRLLRDGVVRLRRTDPPQTLFSTQPPQVRGSMSGVDVLTTDRREGR